LYIEELNIRCFRNYGLARLHFDRGINYIIGGNAQGKSNLIEAIYYLSTGRSFRTNRIANLVKWGTPAFQLKAGITRGAGISSIGLLYQIGRTYLTLDGRRARRMGELLGILNAIIFCPEDIYIVKGSPYIRRRLVDIHISQLSPLYLGSLVRYGRVLRQRNEAIRRGGGRLSHWDRQLVENGLEVMRARARYIERLNALAQEAYGKIRPGEGLLMRYKSLYSDLAPGKEERCYHDGLRSARVHDEKMKATAVGPHRDDIVITIDGRDARCFASDGQGRSVIIALKMAQFMLVKEVAGEAPILLVDDPLAELDAGGRGAVLPFFTERVQCIITATGEDGLLPGKRFMVKAGSIEDV